MDFFVIFAVSVLTVASFLALTSWKNGAVGSTRSTRSRQVFANHKGGVGKSTLCFHLAWDLALKSPDSMVLVVDCSRFGDVSKLLCGEQINAVVRGSLDRAVRATRRWCGHRSTLQKCLVKVRQFNEAAPSNLMVLAADPNGDIRKEAHGDLTRAAASMKELFDSQDLHVLVDTDGGELSALTELGLRLANHVVVPTLACTMDMDRLRLLAEFIQRKGLANTFVACVFNNVRAMRNQTSTYGSVTPVKCVEQQEGYVEDLLLELSQDFPALFPTQFLQWSAERRHASFFSTIRSNESALMEARSRHCGITDSMCSPSATLEGLRNDFRDLSRLLGS